MINWISKIYKLKVLLKDIPVLFYDCISLPVWVLKKKLKASPVFAFSENKRRF